MPEPPLVSKVQAQVLKAANLAASVGPRAACYGLADGRAVGVGAGVVASVLQSEYWPMARRRTDESGTTEK